MAKVQNYPFDTKGVSNISRKWKSIFLIQAILIIIIGCSDKRFSGLDEYYKYTNQKKNGLISETEINGFTIQAKYLAPSLCALEQSKSDLANAPINTLILQNQYCRSFIFTFLKTDIDHGGNLLSYNIKSKEQLKQRNHEVDFHFGKYFYIIIGEDKFYPQLYTADKPYSNNGKLSVRLKFVADSKTSPLLENQDLTLIYDDPFFDTGKSTFKFTKESIQAIPKFKKS